MLKGEDKKKIVSDVNDLANNASSLVLADARGLKVSELSEIRNKANQSGSYLHLSGPILSQ